MGMRWYGVTAYGEERPNNSLKLTRDARRIDVIKA
jgi:hypothetical protein